MQNTTRSNLELGAQIAIAIAAVLVAGLLVKQQFSSRQTRANTSQIEAGEKLNIPNIDWERNQRTLVFFLQKGCFYCAATAPFYRQLIVEADKKNVKSVAVLPNPVEEAREYLRSLELPIENVQSAPLTPYKISGTPTLLFVDRRGMVRNTWFGAVTEKDRESEIQDQLKLLFDEDSGKQ